MPIKRTMVRERTTPESRFPIVETIGREYIKEKYEDTGAILSKTVTYKNALDEIVLFRNLATKEIIEIIFKDYEQKDAYTKDLEIQRVTTHRPISVEFPKQEFPLNHLRNYGPILHANSGITFSQTEVEI
jgi:hypothetical protein